MRLLLAEDEKELSRAVAAVLTHHGYEVDAACDGAAALELLQAQPYDVIVSDIMMPRLDGIELLRSIRAMGDTTPILLLTAKAEIDDRVAGLDAGADDYLSKPFSMKELLARVQALSRRTQVYAKTRLARGNVTLEMEELRLTAKNGVQLSRQEAELMRLFLVSQDRPMKAVSIAEKLWAGAADQDKIDLYIAFLRDKLDAIGGDIRIVTERLEGETAYRLQGED